MPILILIKSLKISTRFSGVAGLNQELYKYGSLYAQGLDMITESVPMIKLTNRTTNYSGQ